jgi:hypothetical protein
MNPGEVQFNGHIPNIWLRLLSPWAKRKRMQLGLYKTNVGTYTSYQKAKQT